MHEAYWYLHSRGSEVRDGIKTPSTFTTKSPREKNVTMLMAYLMVLVFRGRRIQISKVFNQRRYFCSSPADAPLQGSWAGWYACYFFTNDSGILLVMMLTILSNILHGIIPPSSVNQTNIALIPKVKKPTLAMNSDLLLSIMLYINLSPKPL